MIDRRRFGARGYTPVSCIHLPRLKAFLRRLCQVDAIPRYCFSCPGGAFGRIDTFVSGARSGSLFLLCEKLHGAPCMLILQIARLVCVCFISTIRSPLLTHSSSRACGFRLSRHPQHSLQKNNGFEVCCLKFPGDANTTKPGDCRPPPPPPLPTHTSPNPMISKEIQHFHQKTKNGMKKCRKSTPKLRKPNHF